MDIPPAICSEGAEACEVCRPKEGRVTDLSSKAPPGARPAPGSGLAFVCGLAVVGVRAVPHLPCPVCGAMRTSHFLYRAARRVAPRPRTTAGQNRHALH
eukprot:5932334-Prymnesium_polylepis.2